MLLLPGVPVEPLPPLPLSDDAPLVGLPVPEDEDEAPELEPALPVPAAELVVPVGVGVLEPAAEVTPVAKVTLPVPVMVLPPEIESMLLAMLETVLQLDEEGVKAAVCGVAVVPTV